MFQFAFPAALFRFTHAKPQCKPSLESPPTSARAHTPFMSLNIFYVFMASLPLLNLVTTGEDSPVNPLK